MNTRKKLLSINNLKKYFPIAKESIFQKEQLYVKANEEITFDVYEGETIGVVGESGCGKSTLGRVLLQLYDQTAGSTMYYGRDRSDIAPSYVKDTLKNYSKYISASSKAREKAEKLTAECDEAGENATFFQLQDKNLAIAEAKTAFHNAVSILGGLMVCDKIHEGTSIMLEEYELQNKAFKLKVKIIDTNNEKEYFETKIEEEQNEKKIASYKSKIAKIEEKTAKLTAERDAVLKKLEEVAEKLKEFKSQYKDNAEFNEYEQLLDNGIDLARLKYDEMRILRKDLQIIFQDPYSSLNPRMTVGQIIEEGLVTHGFFKHGSSKMKEYILETMENCGLQDYMLHRYPHQFSGGQRQRICIARALAVQPKFVVCDECVSALDVSIQSQIINLLQELKEKQGLTYLFISHDLSVVRYISDKILVMYLGSVVEMADADVLFKDPRHPYSLALLSSIPTTDIDSLSKERILLEGNIPSPIKPPSGCKFHTRCYMACDKCKRVPPPLVEVEPGHFVACHNLDKKMDENGNYLFDVPKTRRSSRQQNQ